MSTQPITLVTATHAPDRMRDVQISATSAVTR
jgi:hypothetical protein